MTDSLIQSARSAVTAGDAAPENQEGDSVKPEELLERRRFNRGIPTPLVIECDEEEAWSLWSHWSSL